VYSGRSVVIILRDETTLACECKKKYTNFQDATAVFHHGVEPSLSFNLIFMSDLGNLLPPENRHFSDPLFEITHAMDKYTIC
jgi:hypothetical protein